MLFRLYCGNNIVPLVNMQTLVHARVDSIYMALALDYWGLQGRRGAGAFADVHKTQEAGTDAELLANSARASRGPHPSSWRGLLGQSDSPLGAGCGFVVVLSRQVWLKPFG